MFKIRNEDLYQHLLAVSATETETGEVPDKAELNSEVLTSSIQTKLMHSGYKKKMWAALFGSEKEPKRKDKRMPNLAGGLNRVEIRPDGICFIDAGGSCGGGYKDNSFIIMPEK